jgi:hypothetical protein
LLLDNRVAESVRSVDADDAVWFLHRLMESAPPIATADIDGLEPATISRLVAEFSSALQRTVAQRHAGECAWSSAPAQREFALINIVTITNGDIIPDTPQPRRLNRVLRVFADRADRFARVTFSKCNEGRKRLILNRGFEVAGRQYEFLAYTRNQALSATAWFVAPIGGAEAAADEAAPTDTADPFNADSIRSWMGDFSKIDAPHKYGSRIGMSFSDSFQTCHVPLEAIEEIPDIIIERQNISYCFTEGCGQLSPWLARRVWRLVRERAALLDMELPAEPVPSAFQVRLQGCKGVLVVNPQLAAAAPSADNDDDDDAWPRGAHVRLRKSMVKFFAPHQSQLEVLSWAAPERGLLTRQIVAVLSFLGIRDETLLAKLRDYCRDLEAAATAAADDAPALLRAAARLGWFGVASAPQIASVAAAEFASLDQLRRMLQCGIAATEPFVAGVLAALDRSARLDLLRATAFVVERSRHALGVVDETGSLNYGEVFFQFSAARDDGARLALAQRVFVTKTPCMHQGDVRVLQAVDVPALHHIVDCVVFPQRGPRPHPSEIGGSDLDGDMYLICWDRDLIPPTHAHPATWHGSFSFDNAVHNSLPRRLVDDGSVFDETNFRLSRKSNEFSPLQADPSAPLRLRKRRSSSHAPPPTAGDAAPDSAAASPRTSSTAEERRVLREQQLLELQLEFGDEDAAARASILELLSPTSSVSSSGGANGANGGSASNMTAITSNVPVALTLANMAIVSEGGDDVFDTDSNNGELATSLSPPLSPHSSDRSLGAATTTTSTSSWSDLSALGLTKMLYIAKENFITNERYHPDAIAQAHLAFADEKGLDCPECTQLAEQFACAVDSVKTGRVVHEYKRPREWPHFMTRLHPTRRSNSILGRLHDAAWQFLQQQQQQQQQQQPPRVADADLCLSGVRDEHIAVALRERNAYEAECEALALLYNHLPREMAARAAGFVGIEVRRQWRRRFDALVAELPLDERLLHASAWYVVTHVAAHRPVRPDAATLTPVHVREPGTSFAWLLDDYLGYIKANAVIRASAARSTRLPTLTINQTQ